MKKSARLKVFVSGGLGNQILQLYALLYLSRIQNKTPILNLTDASKSHSSFSITSFELPCSTQISFFRNGVKGKFPGVNKIHSWVLLRRKSHLVDAGFEINESLALEGNVASASGHFVSFAYLKECMNFELKLRSNGVRYKSLRDTFLNNRVLGVHVRRGDFLGQSDQHGCLAAIWYLETITKELTEEKYDKIIFFSNDSDWVRSEILHVLKISAEIELIDQTDLEDPAESWELLKLSHGLITANSSFSLTAAVFCHGRVIAPYPLSKGTNYREMEETLPKHWKKVSSIWE